MTFRRPRLATLTGLGRSPACYLEMGRPDAPPLVFLHGFAGDLLTWHFSLVPFAGRFRVLAIDLPGHGRSTLDVGQGRLDEMVAWLDEVLDGLGVESAQVVGHSMGGKIALGLALTHPRRVRGLFLAAPAGLGGYFDIGFLHRLLALDSVSAAEEMARLLLGSQAVAGHVAPVALSLLHVAQDAARRPVLLKLLDNAAICEAIASEGVPWDRVTCPVHFVWGTDDRVIPEPDAARLPPDARVTRLAGVGHLPQVEASDRLNALLDTFLREDVING